MRRLCRPLAVLLLLAACSPALNWRAVVLGQMHAVLPCKPDKGTRQVELDGISLPLHMMGCEFQGVLFAISYLPLPTAAAQGVLRDWQTQALRNMQADHPAAAMAEFSTIPLPQGRFAPRAPLHARGTRPGGEEVQAQLAWWGDGSGLYHLAAYGRALDPQLVEPFFGQVTMR